MWNTVKIDLGFLKALLFELDKKRHLATLSKSEEEMYQMATKLLLEYGEK